MNLIKMITVMILLTAASLAAADTTVSKTTTTTSTTVSSQAAVMTPEQQAMMERMKGYMMVSEKHEFLKTLEGNWNADLKFWMAPNTTPEESKGTSDNRIIMGGRFLEETFAGSAMGKPYEGRGFIGYDNLRKEYITTWFDNMATGMMNGSAQYDPKTRTLSEQGSMSCPLTNETHRWYRAVTTFIDNDHYKYETFMKDEKGQEFRSMEINFTRAK